MKSKFLPILLAAIMLLSSVILVPQKTNAAIYTATNLKLEAEDCFERAFTISSYGSGVSVQTPNPKVNDAWLRFQPVDFREGYSSFSIRYAHTITAYPMWIDVYSHQNGTWTLHGTVNLPPTDSYSDFNTAGISLTESITGKKDIYFYVRTNDTKPQFLCIDYFIFEDPAPRQVDTSLIDDWSLFDSGRPDLEDLVPSENITIDGNGDYIIENKIFYPDRDEYAITIKNHHSGSIIIRNCFFGGINGYAEDGLDPGNGMGIFILNSSNVAVKDNYFEYIQRRGVWVQGNGTTPNNNIVISNNKFYCMQGQYYEGTSWGWDAKFIQFFTVNGTGNKIWYNRMFNYPGRGFSCDWINVYCSSGTLESPLQIYYNEILGGAHGGTYNTIGAGMQIGDHGAYNDGGEYIYAKYNRMVYPGMLGMNICGGYRNEMSYNYLYNDYNTGLLRYINADSTFTYGYSWTAMTLCNYSGGTGRDSNHRVIGNEASFQYQNGFVNVTNPPNTIISDNDFTATQYPLDILPYSFMVDEY
jgi:hypothetical protein